MKVVMTTTYWKSSPGGGIKVYLINAVEELKRRDVDVEVIFREGSDSDPENYKIKEGKEFFPIKFVRAIFTLNKMMPNVVHSHGGMYYYLAAGYLLKIYRGTRLVYTFHTEPSDKLSPLKRLSLQFLLSRCDCVTFVSKMLKAKVKENWGLEFKKSAITYAGVKPQNVSEESKKEFRSRYNIKEDSRVLLALGLTALQYKAEGLKILTAFI